jgi:TonB-linked SusC/RagA family outer membrane protein
MKKLLTLLCCSLVFLTQAQTRQLSGTVSDETNQPLPGVSVVIKGTTTGTTTDFDGNYSITAQAGQILVFSYIGFETQEIMVQNENNINVTLLTSLTQMDEVVVIGYGTTKKKDLVGSVGSLKSEDINVSPVLTVSEAIQGKLAGVQIINSGAPGAQPEIRVRGTGSVLGGVNPLYVVDGVIVTDITNINNNDILSIDVLKDASSAAIYGSRGANGVILITTKSGKSGKPKVSFNSFFGFNTLGDITNDVDLADAQLFARFTNEALERNGNAPRYTEEEIANLPNTDWFDLITREGVFQNHTGSISGGTENSKYFVSLGYYEEEGILLKNKFERMNLRANNEYTVAKIFKFGHNIGLSKSKTHNPLTGAFDAAYKQTPAIPVKDENGNFFRSTVNNVGNPVFMLENFNSKNRDRRITGNVWGEVELFNYFKFKTTASAETFNGEAINFAPETRIFNDAGGVEENTTSRLTVGETDNWRVIWDNVISFQKVFLEKHDVSAMVGVTNEEFRSRTLVGTALNVPPQDNFRFLSLGDLAGRTVNDFGDRFKRVGYFGRVQYGYDNKYLLTATIRREGSSKFSANNRWDNFPSIGVGWNITNESFMSNQNIFDYLKLRWSWGETGNDNIASNEFIATITTGLNAVINETIVTGSTIEEIKDANLKWETTQENDLGLEFSTLNGSLTGSLDYYYKKASNLLFPTSIPQALGDNSFITNSATIVNEGFEVSLSYANTIGSDFKYSISGNLTFNENEVKQIKTLIPDAEASIISGGLGNGQVTTKTEAGHEVGSFWLFDAIGIFASQEEIDASAQPGAKVGDLRFDDANGDGTINDLDRKHFGSFQPRYYFGVNLNLEYKNFDLLINTFGNWGNLVFNGKRAQRFGGENIEVDVANGRYSPSNPNPNASNPRASNEIPRPSDHFLDAGDFFRINNITLGYTLPTKWVSTIGSTRARVYISAQNAFTAQAFGGFNPELPGSPLSSGIELNAFPTTAKFTAGFNLDF